MQIAGLVWVLVIGYLALALGAVWLAVSLPRSIYFKVIGCVAVAALFMYPLLRTFKESQDYSELGQRVKHLCEGLEVAKLEEVPDHIHVATSALTNMIRFEDAATYLLSRGLESLEIDASTRAVELHAAGLPDDVILASPNDASSTKVLAFGIASIESPHCDAFRRWSGRYPAQRLPQLRYLGLKLGTCISMIAKDKPDSALTVTAVAERVWTKLPDAGPSVFAFSVDDRATGVSRAHGRAVLRRGNGSPMSDECKHFGGGDHEPGRANRVTLERLIPARKPFAPLVTTQDTPLDFPVRRAAIESDLRGAPIPGVGRIWSHNNIDSEGSAWIEGSQDGYYLATVLPDRIGRTLLQVGGVRLRSVTGLLVSQSSITLVGEDRASQNRWLLLFDRAGSPVTALALGDEQFQFLTKEALR